MGRYGKGSIGMRRRPEACGHPKSKRTIYEGKVRYDRKVELCACGAHRMMELRSPCFPRIVWSSGWVYGELPAEWQTLLPAQE